MDAVVSFATGLVGAVVGGAASFAVQLFVARREHQGRRMAALTRIDAAFRGLIREGADRTPGHPNTEKFFDSILEAGAAVIAFRLVLRPKELRVADWLDARRKSIAKEAAGSSEQVQHAMGDMELTVLFLTRWLQGELKNDSFPPPTFSKKRRTSKVMRLLGRVKRVVGRGSAPHGSYP